LAQVKVRRRDRRRGSEPFQVQGLSKRAPRPAGACGSGRRTRTTLGNGRATARFGPAAAPHCEKTRIFR